MTLRRRFAVPAAALAALCLIGQFVPGSMPEPLPVEVEP